jgi:RNA polymerase sigma-70 factor (ECF subfamily)
VVARKAQEAQESPETQAKNRPVPSSSRFLEQTRPRTHGRATSAERVEAWRRWPPDVVAVEAAQAGDTAVLALISTAAVPKLVAFYRNQGLRHFDAEDMAADACEAVIRTLPKLRDPRKFEAWFWRIARSKLYDHFRRKQRPTLPGEREAAMDDPTEAVMIADDHREVREAYQMLKARDRELLWMRDVAGLSYGEIAGRFSAKEGAIRIGVMRARQRLELALEEVSDG